MRGFVKFFSYLKFFGPGAILASMTIGAGNIVLAPRVGAWAVPVYSALWIVTFAMVTKGLIAYMAVRYSLLSGEHIMDFFSRIRPKGWVNLVTMMVSVLLLPFMIATFLTLLGNAMTLFTGVGNYFVWGIVVGLFVAFVGFFGSFKLLQVVQLVFALFLAAGAVVAVVLVDPDWSAIVCNLFSFRVPKVASWVTADDVLLIPVLLQLAAVYGTMSGQYPDFIAYISWWRNKTGGRRVDSSSKSLRGLKVDLFLSMLIVAVFTVAFMAAGVVVLGGRHLLPNGIDLVSAQQSIYNTINPVMGSFVYPVAVLVVIGGTVYAGMDALPRMVKATLDPVSKRVRGWSFKKFQGVLVLYLTLTSLPLMLMEKPIVLMTLYLFINGVVGFCLFGWGALWANQRHLPEEQRFGRGMFFVFLVNNIVLTVFVFLVFVVR